jgi:hypothetical protein
MPFIKKSLTSEDNKGSADNPSAMVTADSGESVAGEIGAADSGIVAGQPSKIHRISKPTQHPTGLVFNETLEQRRKRLGVKVAHGSKQSREQKKRRQEVKKSQRRNRRK